MQRSSIHRMGAIILILFIGMFVGIILQKYYPLGYVLQGVAQIARPVLTAKQAAPTIKEPKTLKTEQSASQPPEVMTEKQLQLSQKDNLSLNERSRYNKVIHLYGDSIARGWGFGVFEHESPLSRIQDIAQMLLQDNGMAPFDILVRYAWSQSAEKIKSEIDSGMILDGDVVVWEDAGRHENDIEKRRELLMAIRKAAKKKGHKIDLVFTTTFDYYPAPAYYNSGYSSLINDSGLTMNQIVFQTASGRFCSVLDWNLFLGRAGEALRLFGFNPMHGDGIHPNILGNFLLAVSLLQHLGIEVTNYESVKREFSNLPSTYHVQLGWVQPLNEWETDAILKTLFLISDDHYH